MIASFKDVLSPVRFWVWSVSVASGRSRSLPHVSGHQHAEGAFVDGSCSYCGDMTISELRDRLRYVNLAESLCLCRDPAFVPAPGAPLHPVESEVI